MIVSWSENSEFNQILLVEVVVEVFVELVMQILPDDPTNISVLLAVEVSHLPQSDCEKKCASWNMLCISVTLETSHLEISQLNDDAE